MISETDTTSFTIPLKKVGRLYAIEATVDGESGNLIFDTGATHLVLNRTYFRNHFEQGVHAPLGITGNVDKVDEISVRSVSIGGLTFNRVTANAADLGHIENRRGIKVLGLFGFGLIKNYEITIDVVNNRLILNPLDKKGNLLNSALPFEADIIQKAEVSNNILFLKATLGGKQLRFCFDTAAETNALSSDLQNPVLQTVSITRTMKLSGAGSSSREVILGKMNNFIYGDSLIANMETIITYTGFLSQAYGVHIDGVLGYDFVSKGNFCINFIKKQVGVSFIPQIR